MVGWWPVARCHPPESGNIIMGVHADSMHMLKLTMCYPDANRVHIKIHILKARKDDVKLWEKVNEPLSLRRLRRTVAVGAWFFELSC